MTKTPLFYRPSYLNKQRKAVSAPLNKDSRPDTKGLAARRPEADGPTPNTYRPEARQLAA